MHRRIPVTLTADAAKYVADVKHAAGFRPTARFGQARIGWRIWAGPLIFGRHHGGQTGIWHEKGMGWTVTVLGVFLGWTR